ncbi:MAG: RCC1 domain-containing protein [Bacillus subtilis]|nr:RCC1 domain-containing protein [Bacillus subtilis]
MMLPAGEKIIQIGAGDQYSFALSSNHQLFVWGKGLLDSGDGFSLPENVTPLISLLPNETLVAIEVSKFEGILTATTSMNRIIQIRVDLDALEYALEVVDLTPMFTLTLNETILQHAIYSNAFLAVTSNGRLVSLRFDLPGVYEDDSYPFTNSTPPYLLQQGEQIVAIELGSSVSYAITNLGRVFRFGFKRQRTARNLDGKFSASPRSISAFCFNCLRANPSPKSKPF